ncbi:MAG: hypothetical protein EOO68_21070, partial [Moraxellaceae bacterium]
MFGHQLGCDEGSLLKRIARSCLTIAQSCQATALRATTLNSSTVNIGLHHREQELGGEKNSIKKLMGEQWNLLHPNIQARFIREPGLTEPILYRGMMEKASFMKADKLAEKGIAFGVIGGFLRRHRFAAKIAVAPGKS